MKNYLSGLFLILSFQAFSQTDPVKALISKKADALQEQVVAWRRDFHEHPELGNREFRTSEIVAKYLTSLGIEVQTKVASTGVVGILRGGHPGPVVALRADMDGLPVTERVPLPFASKVRTQYNGSEVGVMAACGHDSHVAMLMGAATVLAGMKKDIHGTVKFIFQPAEEGAPVGEKGGAEEMVKEGALENPKVDVIFGLHISSQTEVGKITYRPGGAMAAANDYRIIIKGRSAHGAAPWNSIDPIVTAAEIVNNLQTIVARNVNITENPAIVTVGSIHGGNRGNIIPETVELTGTLRAFSDHDIALLISRLNEVATKTAEAQGATAEVTCPYTTHYPVTYNNPDLTQKMLPTLQATAGADKVILTPPATGAEDFSFFEQKVPGLFVHLGGMPIGGDPAKAPSHHTPDFYIDESGFSLGVKTLCNLTLDYMKGAGKTK